MSQYDELVEFLRAWLYDHPELGIHANSPRWHPRPVSALPSAVELAEELVDSAEFRSLQLGTWLGTTEGQVIEQAVATVIPPMFRPQYALVVAGLKLGA